MNVNWKSNFTERDLMEIEYCRIYAQNFRHGTDGHNIRLIVAKMAVLLDDEELSVTKMEAGMNAKNE